MPLRIHVLGSARGMALSCCSDDRESGACSVFPVYCIFLCSACLKPTDVKASLSFTHIHRLPSGSAQGFFLWPVCPRSSSATAALWTACLPLVHVCLHQLGAQNHQHTQQGLLLFQAAAPKQGQRVPHHHHHQQQPCSLSTNSNFSALQPPCARSLQTHSRVQTCF